MPKKNKKTSKIKSTYMSKQEFIDNLNMKKSSIDTSNNDNLKSINESEQLENEPNQEIKQSIEQNVDNVVIEDKNINNYDNNENNNQINDKDKIVDNKNDNLTFEQEIENNNNLNVNKEKIQQTDNTNQELINEIKMLNERLNYQTEENNKLKLQIEEERKQLISKLEEKTHAAHQILNERKEELEKEKKTELENAKDSIYIDIIANFLDPIILFEQTIKKSPDKPEIKSYIQGYNMIVTMFKDKLNNLGVEQIDVNVGDEFNENFMEAFDVEHVDGVKPNLVLKIVSDGFVFKGEKIIKFTSVVVSK